ncbi:DUF2407 C-terminal domain-containing protein [Dendryphion nanum]|uniref:DUF2407 C-terminal domain-containing protein n=1 Tax=Dendryphion nanum TaxID=256645 RepID=A0A9P9DPL2_9PLEO|nr:DUF2407 C-terminal domain-containing protein [Dendryphion nanum]
MASASPLPDQLVYLIIRFAASIPDLSLPVSSPRTITTLSLKQLIRAELPFAHSSARLRLIYAGKVLPDTVPLSVSLRLPPPPPPRDGSSKNDGSGSKSQGKKPMQENSIIEDNVRAEQDVKKYYIHCSLGDALSPGDLAAEVAAAQTSEIALQKQTPVSELSRSRRRASSGAISGGNASRTRGNSTTTTPAPQGFDRLLTSGFTAQEVATLRSQFQTNLSYTHTPDTMPSAAEMRALEDRWLDSTATDPSPALAGETEAGWGAGFTVEEGGLDDMLYGYLTGFFWPLGALIWGFREEGVWPRRRQLAVVMGVVLNAAFGFMRWSA